MPDLKRWIWRDNVGNGDGGGWARFGVIEITGKTIAINKGMDLQLPHQIVGLGELSDVAHVDVDKSLVVDIGGVGDNRRRRVVRRHDLN